MTFGRCAASKGPTQPGARDAPGRLAAPCFHQLIPLIVFAAFLAANSVAFAQKGAQIIIRKTPPKAVPSTAPAKVPEVAPAPAPAPNVTPTTTTVVTPKDAPKMPAAAATPLFEVTPAASQTLPPTPAPNPAPPPVATSTNVTTGKSPKKVSGAIERYKQLDHWDEVHRREREKKLEELRETERKRAAVQKAAPGIIKDGETLRPILPVEDSLSAPPPPPSILDEHYEYVLLGLAGICMVGLTAYTLFRHRREKEIRILTGKYLSDGTEAAWIQMPALFAGPGNAHEGLDLTKDSEKDTEDETKEEAPAADSPLAKFFKDAPEQITQIRKLLPDLSKVAEDAERKQTFLKLHELIVALKTRADCWDLRPVWQLTSALDLLVKRLADKCKEATPSTTRTIATAIDLLAEICAPGVRPDLIINPPISVLAVDDDPLCLRAVMFALQKAEMTPDTAATGEAAVLLATDKSYDVVFMDIKMPGISGLQACEEIHKLKKNENTPVVFVTVQSDFRTRAESTLVGGSDLMVKPFLMFEITVKVLIYTMRKRLGLAASLKREVASLTGASQIEGKAIAVLPPPRAAQAASAAEGAIAESKEEKAPPTDDALATEAASATTPVPTPTLSGLPVNGTNGTHHGPAADLLPEPRKVYSGSDLPLLHMAPTTPLDREVQADPAPEQGERKSKKWLKRQKELAKIEK